MFISYTFSPSCCLQNGALLCSISKTLTQKGKFFCPHLFVGIHEYATSHSTFFRCGVAFRDFFATKGCSSMTGILRGSLFRSLLSASAAYVLLIAQVSKKIRFSTVHIIKCPTMAAGTGICYRRIPAAPGAGKRYPDRQRLQHWNDGERLPIPAA